MPPHMRDGLSALLMEVFCTFRRPSMCRQVHREFMRNALLDLADAVCNQRHWRRIVVDNLVSMETVSH